jgi:drug/metabolite transporter (DMT)-like permease
MFDVSEPETPVMAIVTEGTGDQPDRAAAAALESSVSEGAVAGSRATRVGRIVFGSPDAILAIAVSLWALNYSVMKFGITQFEPLALPIFRFGIAGLAFLAILRLKEGSVAVHWRDVPLLAVAGFFGVTLSQLTFVYALVFTGASDNALIGATAPIVTAVIATIVGLERSGRRHWIAASIGLGGVVLIVTGSPAVSVGQSGLLGDALAFGNVLFSSISAILAVPLLLRYSVYRVLTYEMLLGTTMLLPIALPSLITQSSVEVTAGGWLALAYVTLATGLVTNLLYFTAVGKIGASRSAIFQYLQAFLGVLFAVILLSEDVTPAQLLGGSIVVASVILSRATRRRVSASGAPKGRRNQLTTS